MTIHSFDIVFDQNNGVFRPGEDVGGHCDVSVTRKCRLSKISVEVKGGCKVNWSERETVEQNTAKSLPHVSEKEFFSFEQLLYDPAENESLEPGQFKYPFQFRIPDSGVFTSFDGNHGHIQYTIEATLEKSGISHPQIVRRLFKVICPVSYGHYLVADQRIVNATGGGLIDGGLVNLAAQIDKQFYCAGEDIVINGKFENNTYKNITPRLRLMQKASFYAENFNKTRSVETKVLKLDEENIPGGETRSWDNFRFAIPNSTTPSILDFNLIKVEYMLKLKLNVPFGYDAVVTFPLVIGADYQRNFTGKRPIPLPMANNQMPVSTMPMPPNLVAGNYWKVPPIVDDKSYLYPSLADLIPGGQRVMPNAPPLSEMTDNGASSAMPMPPKDRNAFGGDSDEKKKEGEASK